MTRWHSRQELPGLRHTIHYLTDGEECPIQEFLDGLEADDVATHKQAINRLRNFANGPLPQNDEVCKQLEGDLWEFKAKQARLFFFIRGRDLHFCCAYRKKKPRLDPRELRRARGMRDCWSAEV